MKRKHFATVAALAGLSVTGPAVLGATTLVSSSGPVASYGNSYDFSTLGSFDYVYFLQGGTLGATSDTSSKGDEKSGQSLFSPLTVVDNTATTGEYLNPGGFTAAQGATITNDGDATSPSTWTASANGVYNRHAVVGDGTSFSYTLAADSTQTLSLFTESFDAEPELSLTSASSGTLLPMTTYTEPSSGDGTAPATGHSAGILTFVVSNSSSTPDTLTFTYLMASTNGASSSVGLQGVTVTSSPVPEPASVALVGLAGFGLSLRRRRATRSV